MTEDQMYQKYVKIWLERSGVYYFRVEHMRLPDIYSSHKELGATWYELKCINSTQTILKPDWRPGQMSWIRDQRQKGCDNVLLLLYYDGAIYRLHPKESYSLEELDGRRIIRCRRTSV